MLFSVKTPPFGKRSTTGTLTIFCPRLESHKAPALWWPRENLFNQLSLRMGDQGRNLFNQLSLLNQSPFPCHLALFRATKRLVLLRLHQLHNSATNLYGSEHPKCDASIQGTIFLVKCFHRTRDGAGHGEQPAQSPPSQGVISQGWKKHKVAIHQQEQNYPCARPLKPLTGKGH